MNLISKAAIVCSWTRTTRSKVKTVRTLIAIENVGIPWKRRRTREVALKTYAYPGGRLENVRIPGRSPWKRTHIWAWIRRYDSPYDFKRRPSKKQRSNPSPPCYRTEYKVKSKITELFVAIINRLKNNDSVSLPSRLEPLSNFSHLNIFLDS